MGVSKPKAVPSCAAPPPKFWEPTPPEFLRHTLLLAVRDGFERITLRTGDIEGWYDMVGLYRGEEFGIIPPTTAVVQAIPAILDGLGHPAELRGCHGESSRGTPTVVSRASSCSRSVQARLGAYCVHWERGIVAELEIIVPLATEAITEAARHRAEGARPSDLGRRHSGRTRCCSRRRGMIRSLRPRTARCAAAERRGGSAAEALTPAAQQPVKPHSDGCPHRGRGRRA